MKDKPLDYRLAYRSIFILTDGQDNLAKAPFLSKGTVSFLKAIDIALLLFFPAARNNGMLPIIDKAPTPPIIAPVAASSKLDSCLLPMASPTNIKAAPPPDIIQAVVFWRLLFARYSSLVNAGFWLNEWMENANTRKRMTIFFINNVLVVIIATVCGSNTSFHLKDT